MTELKTRSQNKGAFFLTSSLKPTEQKSSNTSITPPPPPLLQVLDQASQTQATLKDTSSRLTREIQNHLMSIKVLNHSLERCQDRVEGWKDVVEETQEKIKTVTEDQFDIKATAHQVNTTVAHR